jgi:hypothetical protein
MIHTIRQKVIGAALFALLLVTGLSLAGCDRSLFATDDPEVRSRLSYFPDSTSAHEERENRRDNANLGFGYPTGPSGQ